MLILNIVPFPTVDFTSTVPPCCSISFLQIDSPRPVPFLFKCAFSSSLPKSINNFDNPSGEIPTPVSIILMLKFINFKVFGLLMNPIND